MSVHTPSEQTKDVFFCRSSFTHGALCSQKPYGLLGRGQERGRRGAGGGGVGPGIGALAHLPLHTATRLWTKDVPLVEFAYVPLAEFTYEVFTRMPGNSYRRLLLPWLLWSCDFFPSANGYSLFVDSALALWAPFCVRSQPCSTFFIRGVVLMVSLTA